jgi:putative chitinase
MILKRGSTGDDVIKLQARLNVKQTGLFGPLTEEAVKSWQKSNGLNDDGIVGSITQTALNKSTVKVVQQTEFKLDKLNGYIPLRVIGQIPETCKKFNITTSLRLAHFLSQCGHESAGFTAVSENLRYSAVGLNKIFAKYFKSAGRDPLPYAKKPEKIANLVYANRMSNGDVSSGDGWKFRGRGYIQLTGRSNYTKFNKTVSDDIMLNPDLVSTKYPLMSAAYFFDSNKLWLICDKGSSKDIVTLVTRRVNGGTIGLSDRLEHFNKYYNLLK